MALAPPDSKMDAEGPAIWRTLEVLGNVFRERPEVYSEIASAIITEVLPCMICRQEGINYLRTHPILDPRKWVCEYHNSVNLKLGKLVCPCPSEESSAAKRKYVPGNYYVF